MGIRLWLSPVFGVLIPSFSGLVDPVRHGAAGLLATYVYFSFCAFTIWTTNRWLYLRLPRREDWLENPLRRIGVPYTDDEIAKSAEQLKGKTEEDAVIAYLQNLGLALRNAR